LTYLKLFSAYLGVGTLVGVISGLFGIGGGILMVPLIVFVWHREMQTAIGTSLAVMVPASLAGVLRHHYSFANVDFKLAAALAVGAMLGTALIGAPLAERLPGDTLKQLFGVVMVISGLKMAGLFEWVPTLFH